jgi:hypothetical protein
MAAGTWGGAGSGAPYISDHLTGSGRLEVLTGGVLIGLRYWDGGTTGIGSDGDGSSNGGAGTWNTAIANWDQGQGWAHTAWNNANNDTAVFASTSGTVTITEPITVGGLRFDSGGYTLTGDTLNFAPASTITANANTTIESGITGSPEVSITGGTLTFAPTTTSVTLGAIRMRGTAITLAGTTTGNSLGDISYTHGSHGTRLTKQGTSIWTVNGDADLGGIDLKAGTLIFNGTFTSLTSWPLQPIPTDAKLGGNLTYFVYDARFGDFRVNSGGIVSPGDPEVADGIGTITTSWGTTRPDARTTHFGDGSIYEWQIGGDANGNPITDTVHIYRDQAVPRPRALDLDNFILKILDAGADVQIGDLLPVFTYDDGVTIDMTGFDNVLANFDTSELGADWNIGDLSLVDDLDGTIHLTGLSNNLPGDANGDGVLDAADYILIKRNLGGAPSGAGKGGDLNDDGIVDWADLSALADAMNSPGGGGTIPEPGSAVLLLFGAGWLLRRRKAAA